MVKTRGRNEPRGLARILHENGLTLVLVALFLLSLLGQAWTGFRSHNDDLTTHREPALSLYRYLRSGDFLEAVAENWEGEFIQMSAFVWLTAFLFQKGSPESRDPDSPVDRRAVSRRSPWPVKRGGWVRRLYGSSLSLALLVLFVVSFSLHAWAGCHARNEEQRLHGLPALTTMQYVESPHFWAESFQNWQSEFLSIAVMLGLSIVLRQKGSPESKPVEAPHAQNE